MAVEPQSTERPRHPASDQASPGAAHTLNPPGKAVRTATHSSRVLGELCLDAEGRFLHRRAREAHDAASRRDGEEAASGFRFRGRAKRSSSGAWAIESVLRSSRSR